MRHEGKENSVSVFILLRGESGNGVLFSYFFALRLSLVMAVNVRFSEALVDVADHAPDCVLRQAEDRAEMRVCRFSEGPEPGFSYLCFRPNSVRGNDPAYESLPGSRGCKVGFTLLDADCLFQKRGDYGPSGSVDGVANIVGKWGKIRGSQLRWDFDSYLVVSRKIIFRKIVTG